jgi:hypothetical protein
MGSSMTWATAVTVLCLAPARDAWADGDSSRAEDYRTSSSADESLREGHAERQSAAAEHVQALASRASRPTVLVPVELLITRAPGAP